MPEFKESKVAGKVFDPGLFRKILNLIAPYRFLFYLSVIVTLLNSFVGPSIPFAIRHTIDNEIFQTDQQGLWIMCLVIFGLLFTQGILTYLQTFITNDLGQNAIKQLRENVFQHILNFKTTVFDKTPIGTLITRTVTDVERVADIFSQGLINIIGDLLQLFVIVGFMFYIDWQLALVVLIVFPFLLLASYYFKEAVKSAFQDVRTQVARMNAFLQEHISGMQIIKVFNREEQEKGKFEKINEKHRQANIRSVLYYSVFFPVIEILSAIAIALVVWYGTQRVLPGQMEFGGIVAFILYINMMFRPIRQIANNFNTLQMGMVASDRIFKVLGYKNAIPDRGKIRNKSFEGHITFENVHFAYEKDEYVLQDLNFEVQPGWTLAIVGATGAGKTTITNLLNRMYDLNEGAIKIDGVDIRDYPLGYLRSRISVVLQDVFLFSDTIANNIRLYNENITQKQIEESAALIGADKFIDQLPGRYNYDVQERGATLSAGQRQMISFIRAVIQDPGILILDEATSSVDNETEERIQYATDVLLRGRTSIVIAHRLSTIQNADKILVMDKGRIKEQGTHRELMEQDGLYRKLIKLQFTELMV